tara:strand:+ start:1205 stop:1360 length:156 start_codon:yes stop_codon:yes gene_type:complete
MSEIYQLSEKETQKLIHGLRLIYKTFESTLDEDELIENLERLLYMTGVMQE